MGVRSRSSAGGRQNALAITSAVAVGLTVPAAAMVAEIMVETAPIRWTRDGTTATSSIGFVAYPGDIILLTSRDELDKFSAIADTATSATTDVEYFTDVSG